jgi:predicted O-methyltransferase YrrM
MKEPILMPYQSFPFNGDHFIEQEFLKLRDRFNITTAVETGTCLGYTTLWLAKNFERVVTIELNKTFLDIARRKFLEHPNIISIRGNSGDLLSSLKVDSNTIFFLDAHWRDQCPLHDELKAIADLKIKPVIAIHDFKTDDERFGYDSYKGQPFEIEWIKHLLYNKYSYHYNTGFVEQSAQRGIIYIYPLLICF